ncbi:MAG: hypothetical protein HRU28_12720 [Rhizobiales bacterium]|nr:hypothetical protein [Hyphomicrobiales bacterium]
MKISASKASKLVGKSIPTITRAIKSGKLSAEKRDGGGWLIDESELARVYDFITITSNVTQEILGDESLQEISMLKAKLEAKDEIMVMKDEMFQDAKYRIEDLERQRDKWQEEATSNRLILEDHRARSKIKPRGGFFRFFSKS